MNRPRPRPERVPDPTPPATVLYQVSGDAHASIHSYRKRVRVAREAGAPDHSCDMDWSRVQEGLDPAESRGGLVRRWLLPVVIVLQALFHSATRLSGWTAVVTVGAVVLVCGGFVTVYWMRRKLTGTFVARPLPFPMRLGEPLVVEVGVTTGGSNFEDLRGLLRVVRSSWTSGKGSFGKVLRAETVAAFLPLPGTPDAAGPDESILMRFDVPADVSELPGTDLAADPVVHWELVLEARTAWGRVRTVRPMPVYRPERACPLPPAGAPAGPSATPA